MGSGRFPPEHKCDQEKRISDLESKVEEHTGQLSDGRANFAMLGGKIESLTEKVGLLLTALYWTIAVIIFGVLATGGTALIFVLQFMGQHKP